MNMQTTTIDLTALKAGWMFVGKTFQDGSHHCDECSYCTTSGAMHPYGEGFAHEAYSTCDLGQRPSERPTDCPAYAAHLESLAEQPTETTD